MLVTGSTTEFALCSGISERFEIGFYGEEVDKRSKAAIAVLKKACNRTLEISYNPQKRVVVIEGVEFDPSDGAGLAAYFHERNCLIDATSLGLIESVALMRTLRFLGVDAWKVLYVEPRSYKRGAGISVFSRREFDLSELVEPFVGVPGSLLMIDELSKIKMACFLGFEGSRFGQLLEQVPINGENLSVVFGVPAFSPGWEMNSISNNISGLWENRGHTVRYCSADDPFSAYKYLKTCYAALRDDQELLVCPIGTKPHGIGAALFSLDYSDVGLIYDSPTKKVGRSDHVGKGHIYSFQY